MFRSKDAPAWVRAAFARAALPITLAVLLTGGAIVLAMSQRHAAAPQHAAKPANLEVSSQSKRSGRYEPTAEQWAMLKVEPVATQVFRSEHFTEGKIAINEDLATPVFSPYAGRVTRVLAKVGDTVQAGQPLFFIEATDMVQAQNDFMAAVGFVNKANARVSLTEIVDKQNRKLLESKAGSLRDSQVAEAELSQAKSELRIAETALEAARNRLRILGKTDSEIDAFQDKGRISPETPIFAPIGGTVVSRKLGPGQYVSYTSTGAVDPVYTIGDLSTVWVVAFVRESEAPKVRVGQPIEFKVMAYPDQVFRATIDHVGAALDTATRRLLVRATVDNRTLNFKPEMFASITLYTGAGAAKVAVPRESVIFDSGSARVWVVRDDKTIEQRKIKTGLTNGTMIEVLDGLAPGDRIVTKGSIFVDRAASS